MVLCLERQRDGLFSSCLSDELLRDMLNGSQMTMKEPLCETGLSNGQINHSIIRTHLWSTYSGL